ncbi:MAG: AAA family ATPase [Ardenticatenaceae bacterium]
MLVEFRVKNFKSFQDERVLTLVASSDKSLPENTFPTKSFGKHRLVRSAIVYGPNASGKSNFIQAIAFMQNVVQESAKNALDAEILVQPFLLDDKSRYVPSEFEVTFIHHDIRYQYGFSVDHRRVHEEWLIAYPKGRSQSWFERTFDPDTDQYEWYFGPKFRGQKKRLKELTKASSLFLSVGATFNHEQLAEVYRWFDHYLRVVNTKEAYDMLRLFTAKRARQDASFHGNMQNLLQLADLGIRDFSVKELPVTADHLPANLSPELRSLLMGREQLDIQMWHETEGQNGLSFPLDSESFGTRRLFAIGGPLIEALLNGYVLCVDELDDSLHPSMVRALVNMFHDPQLNPHNAQLIFNTHDVTLLDLSLFRRDQIWLVEKSRSGASYLYSLLKFSPRKDEALAKGYLEGRYGAIPFIREDLFEGLISHGKK